MISIRTSIKSYSQDSTSIERNLWNLCHAAPHSLFKTTKPCIGNRARQSSRFHLSLRLYQYVMYLHLSTTTATTVLHLLCAYRREYVNTRILQVQTRTQRGVRVRKHETPMADRSAINHGGLRYRLAGSTRRQTAAIWLTFLAARVCVCAQARVRVCTRGNC